MSAYTTIQGDTWDAIAKKVYGSEKYIKELMEANTMHLSTLIFSAGVVLSVPEIHVDSFSSELPPWRE